MKARQIIKRLIKVFVPYAVCTIPFIFPEEKIFITVFFVGLFAIYVMVYKLIAKIMEAYSETKN